MCCHMSSVVISCVVLSFVQGWSVVWFSPLLCVVTCPVLSVVQCCQLCNVVSFAVLSVVHFCLLCNFGLSCGVFICYILSVLQCCQ